MLYFSFKAGLQNGISLLTGLENGPGRQDNPKVQQQYETISPGISRAFVVNLVFVRKLIVLEVNSEDVNSWILSMGKFVITI